MRDGKENTFHSDDIKVSMEQLNPTPEQSEKMWQRLSAAMEEENSDKRVQRKGGAKTFWQIAAAVAVMLVLGAVADGMTGGNVYAAIKEFLQIEQSRQDVAGNIADIQNRLTDVYAPEIYGCDGKTMVFGALRGLIVYDMEQEKIAATIDTQKIDCVYYNSDSKHTRVVFEGQNLIVFNMTGDVAEGNYYVFDLSKVSGGELAVSEAGNDEEKMQAYVNAWKAQEEKYTDTFDFFYEDPKVGDIVTDRTDNESKYSERSIVWTDAEGRTRNCFIYVTGGLYYYSIYDYETNLTETMLMNLEETIAAGEQNGEEEDNAEDDSTQQVLPVILPAFTYTGDNEAIEAIWEYNRGDAIGSCSYGDQVVIPGYVIYGEVQKEDELLVFGNFWSYGFQLVGNVLESTSGGEMPACFHLKKTEEGYEVVSVEVTGDGAMYDEGIRAFTKDYPQIYEMYFSGDPQERENAMKEFVAMYVSANNLDIKYMKEYGWDPVPLFE